MENAYPVELSGPSGSVRLTGLCRFTDPDLQPGARWYDGGGSPSDSFGLDGDYYLDDDSGTVYRKEGGTWG